MTCPYARHCRMADLWTCRRRTNSTSCPLPLRLASAPFRPLPAVRSSLFPFSCASVRPSADRPTLAAIIGTRHYIATDGRRAQQSPFRLARSETGRKLCARMVQSWVAPQKTPLTRCDWPEKPDAGQIRGGYALAEISGSRRSRCKQASGQPPLNAPESRPQHSYQASSMQASSPHLPSLQPSQSDRRGPSPGPADPADRSSSCG